MKAFGVYCEGDSFAHGLDPRTKLAFVFLYLVAAFVADSVWTIAVMAAVAVASLMASRISFGQAARMLRPFVWLLLFVVVFDVLFYGGDGIIFELGVLKVSTDGIAYAIKSAVRFCCMLLGTSALMYTTSPTELTDGFAMLLSPLRRLGIRIDGAALALSMTLRFIPLVTEEFARVKEAQESRLADFSGTVSGKLKVYVPVFVPLFSGALRRADTLALAIENRGYGSCGARTCIRSYGMHAYDWAVIAGSSVLLALAIAF